jgi:hypothetical protein
MCCRLFGRTRLPVVNLSFRASQFFASHNIPYFEVSARDMVNVDQAFHALAAKAVACQNDREYVPPPPSLLRPIKLDDKKPSSSELTCC